MKRWPPLILVCCLLTGCSAPSAPAGGTSSQTDNTNGTQSSTVTLEDGTSAVVITDAAGNRVTVPFGSTAASGNQSGSSSPAASAGTKTQPSGDTVMNYSSNALSDAYVAADYSGARGQICYIKWNQISNEYIGSVTDIYDLMAFITSLQGVLNRQKPTVYVDWHGETDLFWYKYLHRQGKLLNGYSEKAITSVSQLLETFRSDIRSFGLTEWDPGVMATSNVAATVCSATNALPVRGGSRFAARVKSETRAAVKINLVGKFTGTGVIPDTSRASTGSKKCDAYIWAMEKYMDKLNGGVVGFLLDANQAYGNDLKYTSAPNRDYIIAKRGFVFDLSPWNDEAASDDPGQKAGLDYKVMIEMFNRLYQKNGGDIFTVCGYVPWHKKYTRESGTSKHSAIDSEWQFCNIISSFNAILDADSAEYSEITNASLYRLYPLKERYSNPQPQNKMKFDPRKKYVYLYLGDYDSASWVKQFVPKMFTDPARGSVPLAWAFNQNLAERIPMVYDYLYEYKTHNDTFVSGDSGAGYLFPSILLDKSKSTHSTLPSGRDVFIKHNKKWFTKFGINFIGMICNPGNAFGTAEAEMYSQFATVGGSFNLGGTVSNLKPVFKNGALFLPHTSDLPQKDYDGNSPQKNGDFIISQTRINISYPFYMFRSILWRPSQIKALQDYVTAKSGGEVVFCSPQDFMRLAKETYNS